MKEKYNFEIDANSQSILIRLSPSIFPSPAILRAAYHFIEMANIIIGETTEGKITVTLILKKDKITEAELEDMAYEFNIQLISSSVEEEESRKHAGARDMMMRAALSAPPSPPGGFRPRPQPANNPSPPQP